LQRWGEFNRGVPRSSLAWMVNLLVRRKDTEMRQQIKQFVAWPVRCLLWLSLGQVGITFDTIPEKRTGIKKNETYYLLIHLEVK
jgi:hypothetical protein